MGSKIASTLVHTPPERGDGRTRQVCKFYKIVKWCLAGLQEDKSDDKRKQVKKKFRTDNSMPLS